MARTTVEVLVDDLDGTEASETVHIGWNGEWRELDLSKRNLQALSRVLDKYWNASRPVSRQRRAAGTKRKGGGARRARSTRGSGRDPKAIRAWAPSRASRSPPAAAVPPRSSGSTTSRGSAPSHAAGYSS